MLPLEHSAIHLTCIKKFWSSKPNFGLFWEWPFYTAFTVMLTVLEAHCKLQNMIHFKIHENEVLFTINVETWNSTCTKVLQQQPAHGPGIQLRVCDIFYVFLNQNICCGYSKEPMTMLKLMGEKISTILRSKCVYLDLCILCPPNEIMKDLSFIVHKWILSFSKQVFNESLNICNCS